MFAVLSEFVAVDPAILLLVIVLILIVSVVFLVWLNMIKFYKRCPSNRILVIYGRTGGEESFRCLHGGAAFVVPMLQDHAWLSLEPRRITVSARPLLKCDSTEYRVPQVFNVAIGTSQELMDNAARRLLGLDGQEVNRLAEDIIASELDRLVDLVLSEKSNLDCEQFHHELQPALEQKLNELGLTLLNFRRE